jgi:hypothetical protein
MKNILVSSTKQWNVGDEFIFYGIKNLLLECYNEPVNFYLHNRNPDINKIESTTIDNSITCQNDLDFFDIFLFAGSPEWYGKRFKKLFPKILESKLDILMLGIGCGDTKYKFSANEKRIIKKAKLITTRDYKAYEVITEISKNPVYCLPCPSIFSARSFKDVTGGGKIGVCIQSDTPDTIHKIDLKSYNRIVKMINRLIKEGYDVELILHYASEYDRFQQFKSIINYSMNTEDYHAIYRKFDLVISSRLHGGLFAYANGIPAILINDDKRCIGASNEVKHFIYKDADKICTGCIESIDFNEWIKYIIKNINTKKSTYLKLLKEVLI